MSGTSNIWKLRLSTEGAEKVVSDLRAIATQSAEGARVYDQLSRSGLTLAGSAERQTQALNTNIAAMRGMRGELDGVERGTSAMRGSIQSAGYQLQDFVVQVQGGTSALVALSQQGSQFLGVFGPAGAIAGAVLTVGLLAAQFAGLSSKADEMKEALDAQRQAMDLATQANERYSRGLEQQSEALVSLANGYRTATDAVRTFDAARLNQVQAGLATQRGALDARTLGSVMDRASPTISVPATDALGNVTGMVTEQARQLSPAMQQLKQALDEFGSSAVVTSDMIATLYNRLTTLDAGSRSANAELRTAAANLMAAAPEYLRLADAQREAAVQFLAIRQAAGASGEELDRYAARFGNLAVQIRGAAASLVAMREGAIGQAEHRLLVEVQRNEAVLAAIRTGGREAGEAMRDRGDRSEQIMARTQQLLDARKRELEQAGRSADEVRETLRELQGEFTGLATRAVDASNRVEEGLKRQARAAREVSQEFGELRRNSQGLLVATRQDELAVREILRATNNTSLDPDRLTRERREAEREAKRQSDEAVRNAERTANSIETTFAGAFTRAFESGADAGKSFLESIEKGVKSLAATIASQLVFRMAVVPVVNAGAGALGYSGQLLGMPSTPIGGLTFGGLFGGASPVASTAGSTQAAMQQGQQSLSLYSMGRYGNLGQAFSNQGLASTGYGWIDNTLNSYLIAPSAYSGVNAAGAVTNAAGYGSMAQNSIDMAGSASAAGVGSNGLTLAGGIGAGASIFGGAFSIMNGLKKGGIGGGVGVLGGTAGVLGGAATLGGAALGSVATAGSTLASIAGGLSATGPWGMVAAAVLAIASALLPGAKPSGRGQETAINLGTGAENWRGLTGDRYSAGNRESSEDAVRQIAALATQLGDALGGARLNTSAAVGVTNSQLYLRVNERRATFGNSEDGARDLAAEASRFLLEEFKSVVTEGDYAGILRASGTVEALQENLTFYEGVYKSFQTGATAANAFQESMDALNKSFGDIYGKAKDLALATDDITKAWEAEQQKLIKQRDLNVQAYDMGLSVRALQATGGNTAPILEQIALMQFDVAAKQQIEQVKATLESLGLSTEDVAKKIAMNEWVLGQERLKIQRDYAEQATEEAKRLAEETAEAQKRGAQSVLDWLNQQALGSTSSMSPAARQQEAELQYRAALAGTDASAVTSAASALLTANQTLYGGATRAYAISEAGIRSAVAQFGQRQAQGSGDTAIVTAMGQMIVVLQKQNADLIQRFDALARELRVSREKAG